MKPAKVMIVEDNTTIATDCSECLLSLGYKITSIQASGEEAIIKAQTELPDVVLMDIHLRDNMDGITAAEQIYNQFQIPVVFLSAYGDRELLERAKKVGSFGYLIKPFEERELYVTLEMALYKAKTEKKQKQMESQIQLLQKMESIGTLAGGLAHDFNNLLYIVLGNINLAEDNLQNGNMAFENLKEAGEICLQAKELTKKLLVFSKGDDSVKEITSIGNLVKNVVVSVFQGSDIQPDIFISDDIYPIEIDIPQIKQVINSIAVNAKEAMFNKGLFKVYCENVNITKESNLTLISGKYVKLLFKDQGFGISKQNIDKIFDPYFSTKERGTQKAQGLGLAICHAIITHHNGLITVKSEIEKGTTFAIYLPAFISKKSDLKKPIKKQVVKPSVINKEKILLMDDNQGIRTFLHKVIIRLGYDVETCIEGNEAVDIYTKAMNSKKPFNAVILNLSNQVGMGGQETMKKLLEIDPNVKGILSTGYFNDPIINNFRAYGFSGFITKPTPISKLTEVLSNVIS